MLIEAPRKFVPRKRGVTPPVVLLILLACGALLAWWWIAMAMTLKASPRIVIAALQATVVLVLCLAPPMLYYLFISTRKYSLLKEFILGLDRLGLLKKRRLAPHCVVTNNETEDDPTQQLRLRSYLQKFEAVYGPLSPELIRRAIDPAIGPKRVFADPLCDQDVPGFTSIFTQGATGPLVLSTVLIAVGWTLALHPWTITDNWADAMRNAFTPDSFAPCFAFMGAYFFSIQMLFRRYVRRDLRGSAYMAVSFRIVMAVTLAWVCEQIYPAKPATNVICFAIGVFPPVGLQIVRQIVRKLTRVIVPTFESPLPLSDLDGLTIWHQTRLEEEDIEALPNMATADIVDLLLYTRFPADRIIDWVDQAILYMYLPGSDGHSPAVMRRTLRDHGVRTASALIYAYERTSCQGDQLAFENILPGKDGARSPVRSLVMTLFTVPNLCLIQSWRGLHTQSDNLARQGGNTAHSQEAASAAGRV